MRIVPSCLIRLPIIFGVSLVMTSCTDSATIDVSSSSTSAVPECNIECIMTKESGIPGVLAPKNSVISKTEFGSLKYASSTIRSSEVSRFYLDTLGNEGWKFQAEEGNVNSTTGLKSLVWCRTEPSVLNLLISINSTTDNPENPGVRVTMMTDTYDDAPCN